MAEGLTFSSVWACKYVASVVVDMAQCLPGTSALAIGRLLLDTQDTAIFPKRHELKRDEETGLTTINLHVPAGVIPLYVPTLKDGTADPSRNSYFHSVLSFATHLDLKVELPPSRQWPKLGGRTSVTCDIIWGGACMCRALDIT